MSRLFVIWIAFTLPVTNRWQDRWVALIWISVPERNIDDKPRPVWVWCTDSFSRYSNNFLPYLNCPSIFSSVQFWLIGGRSKEMIKLIDARQEVNWWLYDTNIVPFVCGCWWKMSFISCSLCGSAIFIKFRVESIKLSSAWGRQFTGMHNNRVFILNCITWSTQPSF